MATLFLSYQHEDRKLASDLELRLKARGHVFQISVSTKLAGDWRAKMTNALSDSDFCCVLTSRHLCRAKRSSDNVWS